LGEVSCRADGENKRFFRRVSPLEIARAAL